MSEHAAAPDSTGAPTSPVPVPPLLKDLAGWTWRLLVLALAAYLTVKLFDLLYFIVLPFFAALFATSLAYPLVRYLRGLGLRRSVATWLTVLLAAAVFGGVFVFVIDRAIADYPDLVTQATTAVTHFRNFLTNDLHIKSSSTSSLDTTITDYLNAHSSSVASGALTGIATVAEGLRRVRALVLHDVLPAVRRRPHLGLGGRAVSRAGPPPGPGLVSRHGTDWPDSCAAPSSSR